MKKELAIAFVVIMGSFGPAQALTLDGGVEKTQAKPTSWASLFAPAPEGRIGIRISSAGHIDYVHPDSPAQKVGLEAHDTVLTVDGRQRAVEHISGEPGSKVHLEVKRGENNFAVDVERIDSHLIHK